MATKQDITAEIKKLREKQNASARQPRKDKIQSRIDALRSQRAAIPAAVDAGRRKNEIAQTDARLAAANAYAASQPSVYSNGALGRLDAVPYKTEIDSLLSILQERAANGLTLGQQTSLRETGQEELNRGFLTARDQAARSMPAWRVRGPASAQIMTNLLRSRLEQQQQLERAIAVKSIDEASNASAQYGGLLGNASNLQTNVDQFNLGQQGAELAGRVGEQFGYGNLYNTTRAGVASENAIRRGNRQSNDAQNNLINTIQTQYAALQAELERQRQEGFSAPASGGQIIRNQQEYDNRSY